MLISKLALSTWALAMTSGLSTVPVAVAGVADNSIATASEAKECVVKATFEHQADLHYALGRSIEQWDEGFTMQPTLRLPCNELDNIKGIATEHRVVHEDLAADIAAESQRIQQVRQTRDVIRNPDSRYKDYLSPEEYEAVYKDLNQEFHNYTKLKAIGKSVEGKSIYAFDISTHHHFEPTRHGKWVIWVIGQNARDWLAHNASACVAENMVRSIDKDPSMKKLFDGLTLSIVTMANPDGFAKTHKDDRMWHKNANKVNLNRNWDIEWGKNSGDSEKDDDYHGKKAFSEPETQAISKYISSKIGLAGYLDIQAFGSKFLYPYGYTKKVHARNKKYRGLTKRMAAAMKGDAYESTSLYMTQGATSGTSVDWVVEEFRATIPLTVKVRGDSFMAEASEIQPTCDELTTSLTVFLKEMLKPGADDSEADEEKEFEKEDEEDEDADKDDDDDKDDDGDNDDEDKDDDGDNDDEDKDDDGDKGDKDKNKDEDDDDDDDKDDDGNKGDKDKNKDKDDDEDEDKDDDEDTNTDEDDDSNAADGTGKKGNGCSVTELSEPQSMLFGTLILLGGSFWRRRRSTT